MMDKKVIVTIGRQYGSGGRVIGRRLAELLDIPYYDKEIITEAALKSGICPEYFAEADEKKPFFPGIFWFYTGDNIMSPENLYRLQTEAIERIASESSCVIVGRCADYILRNEEGLVSCFIHAPMDVKIKNVIEYERGEIDEKKAESVIEKISRKRASYYKFFTHKHWGKAESYDLTIDSSVLGKERTADFIKDFVLRKLE